MQTVLSFTSFRKYALGMSLESELTSRIIEANAGCYFIVDFSRLVPGLGLPSGASKLDGESELMRRMISSGVHIVSFTSLPLLMPEPNVAG